MSDLAPPRERVLKAVRALVGNPDDPLVANLLNAIESTLDEHDAATRGAALAETNAVLREVRSDLVKLYAALPPGLDFYFGKIRLTRLRIDAALGDEHFTTPTA